MRFNKNEEAVSPVIGVILMVAITVILAAVIAVFVFGMTDDIQTSHTVAATAKMSDDTVIVTFQGGPDAAKVSSLDMNIFNGSANGNVSKIMDTPYVGESYTFTNINNGGDATRILITSAFDDGTTQVILDKEL